MWILSVLTEVLGFLAQSRSNGQVDLMAGLCLFKEGNLFWLAHGMDGLPVSDFPEIKCGVQFTLDTYFCYKSG